MSPAAADLCRFVDASPTPFHAVATAAAALEEAGFDRLDETAAWPANGGSHYVVRGGSLVAWRAPREGGPSVGFRIVGAHTDSPNLRLKQHHDASRQDLGVLALEPYGGPILSTWLDRDLTIAGRLVTRDGTEHLVDAGRPVVRVPNLAIHLDRDQAAAPDRQRHLDGLWAIEPGEFLPWLAGEADVDPGAVVGFDLMTADTVPSGLVGAHDEFVAAPRLDNQATCFAGLRALIEAEPAGHGQLLVLFDHEEVGSTSERGAQSDLLATVLERIVLAAGGGREDYHRMIAASICASGDMAHGTHPNHVEKHEPLHRIALGGGPVLKVNQNLRYATDGRGTAAFADACERAGVPLQRYVHRADLPCGSTIGPLSAARTGVLTVDIGAPQLAMHSARELMAAADVDLYVRALTAFLD